MVFEGVGGFRKLREACGKNFHLISCKSTSVVTIYDKKRLLKQRLLTCECTILNGNISTYSDDIPIENLQGEELVDMSVYTDQSKFFNSTTLKTPNVIPEDFNVNNIGGHSGDQHGSTGDNSKLKSLGWKLETPLTDGLKKVWSSL